MNSLYDLITITSKDLRLYQKKRKGKIGIILSIVLEELPASLQPLKEYTLPYLKPIRGFEDKNVRGYTVRIKEHKEIEGFIKKYVPFFILKKEK